LFSPSLGHSRRWGWFAWTHRVFTFLRPFAPRALPRFLATMGALTAARHSVAGQLSVLHGLGLPDIPSPFTAPGPAVAFPSCCFSATGLLPLGRLVASDPAGRQLWTSPFLRRLVTRNGRYRVRCLRTVGSSCVALHVFLRSRSYTRLHAQQAGVGRTCTALTRHACTRT
jgi:hypothetical protein